MPVQLWRHIDGKVSSSLVFLSDVADHCNWGIVENVVIEYIAYDEYELLYSRRQCFTFECVNNQVQHCRDSPTKIKKSHTSETGLVGKRYALHTLTILAKTFVLPLFSASSLDMAGLRTRTILSSDVYK